MFSSRRKQLYEKNGGPMLEHVKNIKLFEKHELSPILKKDKIIGAGVSGEVYWGILGEDRPPVAVKKHKGVVRDREQFANEVFLRSRVIHKNIVKLIGCCLEYDIPILVYEFASYGSLEDILHHGRIPLNLEQRLDIAAQSAAALAYMHSKLSIQITHGNLKPTKILLDDNLVPKISGFGMSSLSGPDQRLDDFVIGDIYYLDPFYIQTGLLTLKSDVYSFGLVLLELVTRKKISNDPSDGLTIDLFMDAYTEKRVIIDLVEPDIAVTENVELLDNLAELIKQCLDLVVDKRPAMTDVEETLRDLLRRSRI